MQRASFSSRFAAMNLDMLIYGAISQGVSMILQKNLPEIATLGNISFLSFLFAIAYFVYPTKKSGQTLGKMLISLKVVSTIDERKPLTWGQAFFREIVGKTLSTIPFFLGYLWAKFNPDGKAWHDSISRTRVVSLVIEEEKTLLQRFQQIMLGILSIPLGVALILIAFLYTSLPLDSIKEKIEASGIQVGALTGSIAGGLRFSEIRRHDDEQDYSLRSVDVKFSLYALVHDRIFIIEKLTAEEGHIEVPEDFSWSTIFFNLMALGQGSENGEGPTLGNFKLAKMNLKNIFFEHKKKVISKLEEFSVRNLEMADKELHIGEAQFQIPGFILKTQDFKSAFGRIEVASAIGGVGPEFLPLLKVPVDFHFKGVLGKNSRGTKIEGGMTIDKIKFTYDAGKTAMTVDKLLLNEMFKTALPLEDLDMKLSAEGENTLQILSSLNIDYGLKVCGNEFKSEAGPGPVYIKGERQFLFRMTPKPVENFSKVVFSPEATLDDLFIYEIHPMKGPRYPNHQEMVADLCKQKPVAALSPEEIEVLKPLMAAADAQAAGASLQALLSKAVPITVSNGAASAKNVTMVTPTPSPTPVASVSPSLTSTPKVSPTANEAADPAAQIRNAMTEARAFLRAGKYAEAKTLMDSAALDPKSIPPSEQGSFYNLKAWIHLYSSQPQEAAQAFEQAFNVRKDISDAEGLLRVNEELKNETESNKWSEYIKTALKQNPELKSRLTPNMQKKFSSEAAGE